MSYHTAPLATPFGHRRRPADEQFPPWTTDCDLTASADTCRRRHGSPEARSRSGSSSSFRRTGFLDLDRTSEMFSDADAGSTDADKPSNSPGHNHDDQGADPIVPYLPHQPKSLSGVALRAFCLGITLTIGTTAALVTYLYTTSPLWRVPFFLAALSLFHFLEFWTTAAYNTRAAEVASFLLTSNWPGYAIAHAVATAECLVTHLLWPGAPWGSPGGSPLATLPVAAAGWILVVAGQAVRSLAMIHAGRSFNHVVQYRRQSGHVLVTDGVYAWLRHPSYFGFFWWALGTQMVMGNAVSFVGYAVVLWRFFSSRIRHEEELLVGFFGREYVEYRARVPTRIPFVP